MLGGIIAIGIEGVIIISENLIGHSVTAWFGMIEITCDKTRRSALHGGWYLTLHFTRHLCSGERQVAFTIGTESHLIKCTGCHQKELVVIDWNDSAIARRVIGLLVITCQFNLVGGFAIVIFTAKAHNFILSNLDHRCHIQIIIPYLANRKIGFVNHDISK